MKNYYYCLLLLPRLVQVANKGQMHIIPKYGESGIVPNINMSRETRYSKSKLKLKEIAIELKLKRKAPTLVIMTYDQQNTHPAVLTSKRLKGLTVS